MPLADNFPGERSGRGVPSPTQAHESPRKPTTQLKMGVQDKPCEWTPTLFNASTVLLPLSPPISESLPNFLFLSRLPFPSLFSSPCILPHPLPDGTWDLGCRSTCITISRAHIFSDQHSPIIPDCPFLLALGLATCDDAVCY